MKRKHRVVLALMLVNAFGFYYGMLNPDRPAWATGLNGIGFLISLIVFMLMDD